MKAQRGNRDIAISFNVGSRWGWVANAKPRPPYPPERDPVSIVQEAGWAPGQVCMRTEYFAPTGIRFPDRPPVASRYTDYALHGVNANRNKNIINGPTPKIYTTQYRLTTAGL